MAKPIDVTIVGGGMITSDQILPSVYHLQRQNVVKNISICSLNTKPLRELIKNRILKESFPDQKFVLFPSLKESKEVSFPNLYKDVIDSMDPCQVVIVAVPDQFHYQIVMDALNFNQHVICVKPLSLTYRQTAEIKKTAYHKGLFVGVEYHKRFDKRHLLARKNYRSGLYGEFVLGEAKLIEPYAYRFSNFQNWFTSDQTDPFIYIGCHYVDIVFFITGLRPVEVSSVGKKGKFTNGNEAYFWTSTRIRYENGALLSLINGLGYPDEAAGAAQQSLNMYFERVNGSGLIEHNDQYRGILECSIKQAHSTKAKFRFVNPDFFNLVPWEGPGYRPVGYGFDSISALIHTIGKINHEAESLTKSSALRRRQDMIQEIDSIGLLATPANNFCIDLVIEAARISIQRNGYQVFIEYGEKPRVRLNREDGIKNH